jgi:hypothetical protein
VCLRVCPQHALDAWWLGDQFAKLLKAAFRLNHPVKPMRFCKCRLTSKRESLVFWPFFRRPPAVLEQLWNDVGKTFEVDILCGYALSSFHGEKDEHVFQSICAEHSAVYSHSNNYYRLRMILVQYL